MRTFKFKAVSVAISMALALALPFGVMAADFSDGAAAEDTWDDVEFDAPVEGEVSGFDFGFGADFDEPVVAPSEASDEFGASFDAPVGEIEGTGYYTFYYNEPGFEDFDVYYDGAKLEGKAVVYSIIPADCENPARFIMKYDVDGYPVLSEAFDYRQTDAGYVAPLGHKWETAIKEDLENINNCSDAKCPCTTGVKITNIQKCSVCGKFAAAVNANNEVTATTTNINQAYGVEGRRIYDGHKWGDAVTIYLKADGTEITASEATDADFIVTYQVCKNVGCDHFKFTASRKVAIVIGDYSIGENVAENNDLTKLKSYPPTDAELDSIILIDCSKDGSLNVPVTSYKEVSKTKCDTKKELKEHQAAPQEDQEAPQGGEQPQAKKYTVFELPEEKTATVSVTVPAHHAYRYKYVLKDEKLANYDAENYVSLLNKDGQAAAADVQAGKVEGVKGKVYPLDTIVGNSKYCVPFEVEVIKTTVCADKSKHTTKAQIETSEGIVVAQATAGVHHIEKVIDNFPKKNAELTFAQVKQLKDLEKTSSLVITTEVTDCTKGGKGTAAYKCDFCGQVITSTKVPFTILKSGGHNFIKLEKTEVVDATCTSEGSFVPVLTCEYCDVKTVGEKQIVPKTDHVFDGVSAAKVTVDGQIVVGNVWGPGNNYAKDKTFEAKADKDGKKRTLFIGELDDKGGQRTPGATITLTRKCTVCGQDAPIVVKSLQAKVTAVTKEGADGVYCKEGTITMQIDGTPGDGKKSLDPVSEVVTLRYYSSADEFKARYAAHTPGEVVKSNEVAATETEAGGYDETISCIFCDKVISQRHVTIPALGHTHDMVAVEAKEATCTEAGNVAYYECKKCGLKYKTEAGAVEDQLTDEQAIIPATGHTMELVEAKEATCVAGHPAYYVCTTCTKMFKDAEGKEELAWEDIKIDPTEEHTPAKAVVETRDGSVFSVVYCDRCGTELSVEPYKGETVELLAGPKTFNLKANKPNAGYMDFKLGEVEGAEKYRVSYRIAGTKPYTRQESDTNVVKITDLERGQIYDFTACAGDVLEDGQIQWGARALKKDGTVKYARRWYETVEQSKIDKKGTVITLEWTALKDASKYEISIADNKEMKNAVTVDAAMFNPSVGGETIHVSADITKLPDFEKIPAGATMKFYVRIRPYTLYGESHVPGGVSNLRAKTIKF